MKSGKPDIFQKFLMELKGIFRMHLPVIDMFYCSSMSEAILTNYFDNVMCC